MNDNIGRKDIRASILERISQKRGTASADNGQLCIEIALVKDNPYQPRLEYNEELIVELAKSIKSEGLLQPVPVIKEGKYYILISGHRRLRAYKYLKRDEIPVVLHQEKSPKEMMLLSVIENLRREDLNLIEEAMAYDRMAEAGLKNKEIAKSLGVAETAISRTRNLLKLSKVIISDIMNNKSTTDITALSFLRKIKDEDTQVTLYYKFLEEGRAWLKDAVDRYLKGEDVPSTDEKVFNRCVTIDSDLMTIDFSSLNPEIREKMVQSVKKILSRVQ